MRIGEIEVTPLIDGVWRFPVPALYDKAEDDWAAHAAFFEDGMVVNQLGAFLVRTADRTVLIDAGNGPSDDPSQGRLLHELARAGVAPDEVTDVVLTHLHFDHVGWVSDGERPTFPRATYRCDEADWRFFTGPDPCDESTALALLGGLPARVRLAPIEAQLTTWSGDASLLPGLDVRAAPGHTPGSALVVLSSGAARALVLGDVVHCPLELLEADWHYLHDVDPALARRTRAQVAAELEGDRDLAAASHFPGLRFGRLVRAGGARRWSFADDRPPGPT